MGINNNMGYNNNMRNNNMMINKIAVQIYNENIIFQCKYA